MSAEPVDIFRQEAEELFAQLETALLDLETTPDNRDLIATAFRALHTIKGSGAMFGFDALARFTHHVESAFDRVRSGEVKISSELIGVTLAARDHMRLLMEQPESVPPEFGAAILDELNRALAEPAPVAAPVPRSAAAPGPQAREAAPAAATGYRVRFTLPANALLTGTNPLALLQEMLELGEGRVRCDTSALPPLDGCDPERLHLSWEVELVTGQPESVVEDVFLFVRDETDLTITPLTAPSEPAPLPVGAAAPAVVKASPPAAAVAALQPAEAPSGGGSSASAAKPASEGVVKVNADRIDSLMNQVGELVIAQSRLKQIVHSGEDLSLLTLRAITEDIERLVAELRDTTMGIRMVPIGSLFSRFRRVVRDISRDLGKEVQLVTLGEDTELDKTVVEALSDPLVHLIRNAVDHGVESAAERLAAGKPAEGKVQLTAAHFGGQVLITVSDDGKGLDRERIRAKAEERGLLVPGAEVAESDLFELIFHPGFSTAGTVTSVSGRGVGMDVVKRTIDGLRGTIEIASRPGQGSCMTLRLPLTLAIIDGLLVRVGEGRYIVPLSVVDEIVELDEADNGQSETNNLLFIRDELVPFLRLRDLFGIRGAVPPYEKVVIVSAGERRIGLVVDYLLGDHQTVIKSLSRVHADVKCFSGATILGDGRVALILDIVHLIETARSGGTPPDGSG